MKEYDAVTTQDHGPRQRPANGTSGAVVLHAAIIFVRARQKHLSRPP
jgi:hypothetical protein